MSAIYLCLIIYKKVCKSFMAESFIAFLNIFTDPFSYPLSNKYFYHFKNEGMHCNQSYVAKAIRHIMLCK